jgi:malonate-semialdehyde dehydrogenase (acetylating)/methylmalonate-semialdehyde dehydrogenase
MSTAIITEAKVPQYIDGHWSESAATEWQDVINPATGDILAKVPLASPGEVTRAIDAAAAAYPEWRRTPPEDRIQPLFKLKMLLEEHIDDFGRLITQENG